jgi:enoyl-CoA hydratase/carnithine racemase
MMPTPILCETRDGVTTVTLNRPEIGNRITNDMAGTLATLIDSARDARVIVLKGAGNDFCLGRDLPHPDPAKPPSAVDVRNNDTEPMLSLFARFQRTSAPIVAIVQGKVQGGACAIVGLCDVTIASDDSTYVLPEMQRGIPPCLAMTALARRMPRKALTHLVYSGDPIDAQTALAFGIVSRVVAREKLEAEGEAFIRKLVGYSDATVRTVKEYMRSAPELEFQAAADLASNIMATVMSSRR